jgi:hypothetical protein
VYAKSLSAISFTLGLMNPHSGINDNNKKERTKAIAAAIPMAGILVAAALLSGLPMVNNYQPAIAQQLNMTGAGGNATTAGGNATTAGGNATTAGGNATTAGGNQTTSEVRLHLEEVRTAIENDDDEAALMHLDLALNALGGNMTTTAGGNATNATAALGGTTTEEGDEGEEGEEGDEEEG